MVDNTEDKTQAPDIAKQIGATIESWIHAEMLCVDLYHINGLESSLISVAIFEKAKENMGRLRAAMNGILAANDKITVARKKQPFYPESFCQRNRFLPL